MGHKDINKIHVLEKEDYFHRKVKMHLHLMSRDTSYVDCIESGVLVPMIIATELNVNGVHKDRSIPKILGEWTEQDKKGAQVQESHKKKSVVFREICLIILSFAEPQKKCKINFKSCLKELSK